MSQNRSIRVVAAEIEDQGRFLITQRRPSARFPLYWEFPSGKVEAEESDETALKRELQERLGVKIKVNECSMFVQHHHHEYSLDFYVYTCQLIGDDELKAIKVHDWRWVSTHEMVDYSFPPADAVSIKELISKTED